MNEKIQFASFTNDQPNYYEDKINELENLNKLNNKKFKI